MTTLLTMHNSDGLVGRCDANCYNAKTNQCRCICGGRNHGVGLDRATQNTRDLPENFLPPTDDLPEDSYRSSNWTHNKPPPTTQLDLFDNKPILDDLAIDLPQQDPPPEPEPTP